MADRKVCILDPHTSQPLKGIVVEARAASDGSFISTARTNDEGIASFSLTVAATFHARTANTPPLYQIVIPIDQSWGPFWFNYLVDPAWAAIVASGEGSEGQSVKAPHGFTFNVYSTLAGATAAAIASASTSGEKTILVVSSITEQEIDIGGLGSSASIIITAADRYAVTISATDQDLFDQDSTGGATAGRLVFRSIGLIPSSGKAVLDVNTASELKVLAFEDCDFPIPGDAYMVRQDGSDRMQNIKLRVRHCTGALAGFYQVGGNGATFSPDSLEAFDNILTLASWWDGGAANAAPSESVRVQGGLYTITNGITTPGDGPDEFHWGDLMINFAGDEALFTSPAASDTGNDWSFRNIVLRTTHVDSAFLNLGGGTAQAPHDNIYIQSIFGYSATSPAGTFITIDADLTNVYVSDIHAPEWPTVYDGPTITPAVPPVIDHGATTDRDDDDHTQYILADGTRAFTGAADLGGNVINNVANPVLGGDAVNLNTLLDSMTIALHYHFLASNVMSSVFSAGEAFEDELITGTPQELTTIFQVSTVADTPTPATVGAGTLISVHFDAEVLAVSGKKPVFVYVQLGYVDADGSSNFVQIGADSDPTTVALTTDQEEVELHIHVDAETNIPAGKRLKVKWWATTTGALPDPTVHIYYGALNDHITIPISASILTNFLRQDGTTPLTGNWDPGPFVIGNYAGFTFKALSATIGDAAYGFLLVGGNPTQIFDTAGGADLIAYNRGTDVWEFQIDSVTSVQIDATGLRTNVIRDLVSPGETGVTVDGLLIKDGDAPAITSFILAMS